MIEFFNWNIKWWLETGKKSLLQTDPAALGSIAYANQQAFLYQSLGMRFRRQWVAECYMNDLPVVEGFSFIALTNQINLPISPLGLLLFS